MAHWGVAYAIGPNYNKAWDAFDPADLAASLAKAFTAAQRALACASGATAAEQALLAAIAARYPALVLPVDAAPWNESRARAMRRAYRDHPGDLDIAALFADALLNVTPWQLWDLPSGEPCRAHTPEAARVLELALERPAGMVHPGVLHMYIHLMEMSPHPERALRGTRRAGWCRTAATCSTCRPTSTSCAGTTGGSSPPTPTRSRRISGSWPVRDR